MKRSQYAAARDAWVCWAIASDTRMAYGSLGPPERERPAVVTVPGEDRVSRRGRDGGQVGHATRIAAVKRRLMAG